MARKLRSTSRTTDFSEFSGLADFAANLPEKFLQCRDFGHNWRRHGVAANNDGTFDRSLRCGQCGTLRIMVLSNRGMVLSSRYEHPDGYLTKGLGRVTGEGKGLLRIEAINREISKTSRKAG
jgi:hypothetical protein